MTSGAIAAGADLHGASASRAEVRLVCERGNSLGSASYQVPIRWPVVSVLLRTPIGW